MLNPQYPRRAFLGQWAKSEGKEAMRLNRVFRARTCRIWNNEHREGTTPRPSQTGQARGLLLPQNAYLPSQEGAYRGPGPGRKERSADKLNKEGVHVGRSFLKNRWLPRLRKERPFPVLLHRKVYASTGQLW
jgi:hypothetical protein